MPPYGEPLDVLEHEIGRLDFEDDAHEFAHEPITGVIESAVPDEREALTWRSTEHYVDSPTSDSSSASDFGPGHVGDGLRDHRAMREVELVYCAMNGIDFHSRYDIEPCLLETQAEAAGS